MDDRVLDGVLRANLLDGVGIIVAGAAGGELGDAVAARCGALGANVHTLDVHDADEEAIDVRVAEIGAGVSQVGLLVNDGAALFDAAGRGLTALRTALDGCWLATRAVANAAFIGEVASGDAASGDAASGDLARRDAARGGRIVNLAPRPAAGDHAGAARAGLENLARTLSVEWARFGVCTTTIAPGAATDAASVAVLVAFLASPAGGYYSGCLFTLDGAS